MCGLAGWYQPGIALPAQAPAMLAEAARALARRGPDAQATWVGTTCGLAHARLAILDLDARANQPMADPTGRYRLVYNGEIFNYRELADELAAQGVTLHTTSDTEVLLQLLVHQGPAAVLPRLNGFWALALYDAQADTLLLARDRYGIKPLLLAEDGAGGLRFASEAKALLPLGLPKALDHNALALYLELNYVPPGHSMWAGVRPLAPGHWLQLGPGGQRTLAAYYQLPPVDQPLKPPPTYAQAQAGLRTRLAAAVERRLLAADVPVGVFLSGGVDSSVVAALAAKVRPDVQTFSLGFEDQLFDETPYAQQVAKLLGTRHTVFRTTAAQVEAQLDDVLAYLDEPFADAAAVNLYALAQQVRPHVTVALAGDGADELLGGYAKHLGEAKARTPSPLNTALRLANPLLQQLPATRNSRWGRRLWQLQRYAAALALDPQERYRTWAAVLPPTRVAQLLLNPPQAKPALLGLDHQDGPGMGAVLRADLRLVLPGDMLPKVDRMSMAHGLEVRVPFLDHTVVDYALSLPPHYLITAQFRKRLLQDAFRQDLPASLYRRPKQGFEAPMRRWLLGPLRPRVDAWLLDEAYLNRQGLFCPQAVKQLWQTLLAGRNGKEDWTLWALLVFQAWWERYFRPQP